MYDGPNRISPIGGFCLPGRGGAPWPAPLRRSCASDVAVCRPAREAGLVTGAEREHRVARTAEARYQRPVARVDGARARRRQRRELARVRGLPGPRVGLEDREVLERVVADAEPRVDGC